MKNIKIGEYYEFIYELSDRKYKYHKKVCRVISLHENAPYYTNYNVVFIRDNDTKYYTIIADDFLHITKKSISYSRQIKLKRLKNV